jgi:hypothetical protein
VGAGTRMLLLVAGAPDAEAVVNDRSIERKTNASSKRTAMTAPQSDENGRLHVVVDKPPNLF